MEIIVVLCNMASARMPFISGWWTGILSFNPLFMLISLLSLSQIACPGCTGVQSNLESSKLYPAGDGIETVIGTNQRLLASTKVDDNCRVYELRSMGPVVPMADKPREVAV